ncbi:MAG: hypothetical protein IPF93_11315 [Saprospiraceae bacterium]|nr:hypothetical protein [Saprospiraceae bacterium]
MRPRQPLGLHIYSPNLGYQEKTLVDKNKHDHSAIYYYPGYFRAKLLIDSQVVKTHDVQIATDGWLCLIENGDRPLYFDRSDFEKQGLIEIDESTLKNII